MVNVCSGYAPPGRLIAGDSWTWEIADPADHPSAAFLLTYALAPEADGGVVEVRAEAPSPIAVAFAVAAGRWRWSLLATDPALGTRATIASGTSEVLPDPLAGAPGPRRDRGNDRRQGHEGRANLRDRGPVDLAHSAARAARGARPLRGDRPPRGRARPDRLSPR
jgi:hypothetical protein